VRCGKLDPPSATRNLRSGRVGFGAIEDLRRGLGREDLPREPGKPSAAVGIDDIV
jgi:hypothetical protein